PHKTVSGGIYMRRAAVSALLLAVLFGQASVSSSFVQQRAQEAGSCSFDSVLPGLVGFGPEGGTDTINVSTNGDMYSCSWTATSDQPWVRISNGSGMGSGSFTMSVGAFSNLDLCASRDATITVQLDAGQNRTVSVTQLANADTECLLVE